jgi:hypothetical protein
MYAKVRTYCRATATPSCCIVGALDPVDMFRDAEKVAGAQTAPATPQHCFASRKAGWPWSV